MAGAAGSTTTAGSGQADRAVRGDRETRSAPAGQSAAHPGTGGRCSGERSPAVSPPPGPATGRTERNIVIIGMPGAGKSTMGVILAKALGRKFLDTDIAIQERTGRLLQAIIDEDGPEAFRTIEEETILALRCRSTVIATGGSAVFSGKAMAHLKEGGTVIYLRISFEEMVRRLGNITTRGIVLVKGQGLREMYDGRIPLYEHYADLTIDCTDDRFEDCVGQVIEALRERA